MEMRKNGWVRGNRRFPTLLFLPGLFALSLSGATLSYAAENQAVAPQKNEINPISPQKGEIYLLDLAKNRVSFVSELLGGAVTGARDIDWFDNGTKVGFVVQRRGVYAIEADGWIETKLVDGDVESFLFSSGADRFYYTKQKRFYVVDSNGKKLYSTDFDGELISCAPNGGFALLESREGTLYLFDLKKTSFDKISDRPENALDRSLEVKWLPAVMFMNDESSLWVVDLATKRLSFSGDMKNISISPTGDAAVFRKGGGQAVYLLDIASKKEKALYPEGGYIHAAWSRDGNWIVLVSHDGRLRLTDRNAGQQKVLVDVPYDWQWEGMVLPFWSGSGDRIYYVQKDGVWEVSVEGQKKTSEYIGFPFWVAPSWKRTLEYGQGKVTVVDLMNGARRTIMETEDVGRWWAKWAPDGDRLLLFDFPPLPQWQ